MRGASERQKRQAYLFVLLEHVVLAPGCRPSQPRRHGVTAKDTAVEDDLIVDHRSEVHHTAVTAPKACEISPPVRQPKRSREKREA